jgi:hypothetical protein
MSVFVNRLPISFGGKGILCYDLGMDGEPAFTQTEAAFSSFGNWLAIASLPPKMGLKTLLRDPSDFPDHLEPFLLGKIAAILAEYGTVALQSHTLHFEHEDGHQFVVHILFDRSRKQYFVMALPTSAGDPYDAYLLTQELFARLNEQYLPDTEIKIGIQETIPIAPLTLPNLSFRPDGTQSHTLAQLGLQKFGPYSRAKFREKTLRVLVICHSESQTYLSNLVRDLKDGMPGIKADAEVWGQAWHTMFGFKQSEFEMKYFETYEDNTFRRVIERTLADAQAKNEPFDLVIYEAPETAGNLEAMLMQLGLPTHHLLPSELQHKGVDRAQLLLDLALMLYAKAGGEPWLLPLQRGMEHELVIGVGSQVWAEGVIGFSTIFSSHGDYKLGQSKWNSTAESWAGGLANFIAQQLTKLSRNDGWKGRDKVKVLFHLDQRLSGQQIQNLRDALQQDFGPTYDLQIAFLLITYEHSHQLWNTSADQSMKSKASGRQFMPDMGTIYQVNADKYLLQCSDPKRASTPAQPLLVELLPFSDDWGLHYMVQQVFHFAGMSWRSVHRATLPATLEYGTLVAGKGHLLQEADPNIHIPEKLHSIPWYL